MLPSPVTCFRYWRAMIFQEGLKNFRDLAYLGSTLSRWDENMVVYADMIQAREKAYAGRIPRVDALLAGSTLETLEGRREKVEGRINDVVMMEDVAALGTPAQRAPMGAHCSHRSGPCCRTGR